MFLGSRRAEVDAEERALKLLTSTTDDKDGTALFACGGHVTIGEDGQQPVTLRYDSSEKGGKPCTKKIVLPNNDAAARSDLLSACYGSDGVPQEDDKGRPRAGELESSHFSTSFNPYEAGITEGITRYLYPDVQGTELFATRGIRAELSTMIAVAGPHGPINAMSCTIREVNQVGTLVVCLPFHEQRREGLCGGLDVRRDDQRAIFSWTGFPDHTIPWAAYLQDSLPRYIHFGAAFITLTYKLFNVQQEHIPRPLNPGLGATTRYIEKLLNALTFIKDGCTLGINCKYNYAHTSQTSSKNLAQTLKGIDLALYEGFISQGLRVRLRPVLMPGPHDRHLRPYKLVYGGADTDDGSEGGSSSGSTAYEWSESDGNSDDENFVTEDLDEDEDATSDVSSEEDFYSSYDRDATPSSLLIELWKELQQLKEENEFSMLERGRGSEGGGDDPAAAIQCDAEMDPRYTACGRNWAAVGRSVQPLVLGDKFSCKGTPEVDDLFRTYKIKQNFRWANQPKHEELAYVGSEIVPLGSRLKSGYTSLVILVDIQNLDNEKGRRSSDNDPWDTSDEEEDEEEEVGEGDEDIDEEMGEDVDLDMDAEMDENMDLDEEEEEGEEDEEEEDEEEEDEEEEDEEEEDEEEEDEEEEDEEEEDEEEEDEEVSEDEEDKEEQREQEEEANKEGGEEEAESDGDDDKAAVERGRNRQSAPYRPARTATNMGTDKEVTGLARKLDVILSAVCESSPRKRSYQDDDDIDTGVKKRRVGRPTIKARSGAHSTTA